MQTHFSWNSTICFPVWLIFLPGKERCSSRVLATNSIPPRVPLYQSSTHTHCLRRISGAQALCPPHTDDILRTSLPSVPISSVPAVIWLSLTVSRGAELGSQEVRFLCRKFIFLSNSRLEPLRHRKELKFSQSSHAWMSDDKWSVISDKLASPSSHFCLFSLPDFSYLYFFSVYYLSPSSSPPSLF